jgi:hypothetical protein
MRAMRRLAVVLVVMVAACRFDRGGIALDGGIDASVDASTCGVCNAAGDTLLGCEGQPDRGCPLGCSSAGSPHCMEVAPSNGVTLGLLDGVTGKLETQRAATVNQRRTYTIDTDSGKIVDYGDTGFPLTPLTTVRDGVTGVSQGMRFEIVGAIGVLVVDAAHIAADSRLLGVGGRPLAILSRGDVLIEGAIDFGASCYLDDHITVDYACPGPGGGRGGHDNNAATGCGPGGAGLASHSTGGGGGAMGNAGGPGGMQMGARGGLAGNKTQCWGSGLQPFGGGGGGGAGGNGQGGDGGGGGGAIQISGLTSITINHPLNASTTTEIYAGGAGGRGTPTTDNGGGGGGAGGGILLEAPTVIVHGVLAANGGGGGGGRVTGPLADGTAGSETLMQAPGGAGDGVGNKTGSGGLGGAQKGVASMGIGGDDGTGGGGGAAGVVQLKWHDAASNVNDGQVSPTANKGPLGVQ